MKRTLVIGDIHGGLRALVQVFERANVTVNDKLIFLGDYADGWSESAPLIDFLIDLNEKNECIFIKGNHDVYCYQWLDTTKEPDLWLKQGGEATRASYEHYDEERKLLHFYFLENLKNYYIDEKNRLFIHAGFSSMHGPEKEIYETNYTWDRTLWETAVAMDKHLKLHSELYPKRLKLFHDIYIGHTTTLGYKQTTPMNKANVWNIDTGAGFTGCLSILDIETKEFWQSDPLPELYPDEIGRNK